MQAKKKPGSMGDETGLEGKCLTMSYSHMGNPHTTIGAEPFHF